MNEFDFLNFFTCFILSRSNESVSLPLPTGRTLRNKNRFHQTDCCGSASQTHPACCGATSSHLETIDLSAELARSHGFFAPSRPQRSRGFTDTLTETGCVYIRGGLGLCHLNFCLDLNTNIEDQLSNTFVFMQKTIQSKLAWLLLNIKISNIRCTHHLQFITLNTFHGCSIQYILSLVLPTCCVLSAPGAG